jgi:hypothetical protein
MRGVPENVRHTSAPSPAIRRTARNPLLIFRPGGRDIRPRPASRAAAVSSAAGAPAAAADSRTGGWRFLVSRRPMRGGRTPHARGRSSRAPRSAAARRRRRARASAGVERHQDEPGDVPCSGRSPRRQQQPRGLGAGQPSLARHAAVRQHDRRQAGAQPGLPMMADGRAQVLQLAPGRRSVPARRHVVRAGALVDVGKGRSPKKSSTAPAAPPSRRGGRACGQRRLNRSRSRPRP